MSRLGPVVGPIGFGYGLQAAPHAARRQCPLVAESLSIREPRRARSGGRHDPRLLRRRLIQGRLVVRPRASIGVRGRPRVDLSGEMPVGQLWRHSDIVSRQLRLGLPRHPIGGIVAGRARLGRLEPLVGLIG